MLTKLFSVWKLKFVYFNGATIINITTITTTTLV